MAIEPFKIKDLDVTSNLTISSSPVITSNGANQLIFNSGATGDIGLLLTSNTKAVTLTVDTNQQLKILGGVDSFVFDVSSATGGITFPDGTTQNTAAGGGGGGFERFNPNTALVDYGFNQSILAWEYLAHEHTICTLLNSYNFFIPFYSPVTATLGTMTCGTISASGTVKLAIFDSTANDLPNAPLGAGAGVSTTFSAASNTVVNNGGNWYDINTLTPATGPTLTANTLYWFAITASGSLSVAGRESLCSFLLSGSTFSQWYSSGSSDPGILLHISNVDSGTLTGELVTGTVPINRLQSSNLEVPIVGIQV